VTAPSTTGNTNMLTGFNKVLEPPFTGDSYRTPKDRKRSLLAKLSPSLYFYARGITGTVRRAAKMSRRGVYDGNAWTQSSLEVFDAMEAAGGNFEITGMDNIDALEAPVVFVGNHMSTLETFIMPSLIQPKRNVTFVVKESLMSYFWFGDVLRPRDPIVVGRTNPREDLLAVMGKGKKLLGEGTSIIIFPQTTRTDTFDPSKFNTIGAKLAARAGVKIVPVALQTNAWGNGERLKDFGPIRPELPIHFAFGEPITPEGKGDEAHRQTIDFIEGKMQEWNG
jgi:1-acyl-sn-glycerol-3-phosphate acyltransferase